jgi:hypothetical protein
MCAFSLNLVFKQDKSTSHSKMDHVVDIPLHMAKRFCHWVFRFHIKPTHFIEMYGITLFTDASWKSQILKSAFGILYLSLQPTKFTKLPGSRNHLK